VALFPLRLVVWIGGVVIFVALEILYTPFEALAGLARRLREPFKRKSNGAGSPPL
jgi:hypothetical protein